MYSYCQEVHTPKLLQHIVESRKETILAKLNAPSTGNLNYLFSTKEAQEIIGKQPNHTLPPHYFTIEKSAQNVFGCLLSCWTEFEIFLTIQNSINSYQLGSVQSHQSALSEKINEHYHYEIVSDIAADKRLFQTEFSKYPLLLSDAIVLINIATFIKEHKWYEMLTCLDISSKGEHFILYQLNEKKIYPTIISSALIEAYQDKKNWLFFNDFFQSDQWKSESSTESLPSFFPQIKTKLNTYEASSSAIENTIFSSIVNKVSTCGVIRFTVNGESSKMNYYMYLAQKGLANALYKSGRHTIFSIIEQPAMVFFYQKMNQINQDAPVFMFTSSQDINKSGLITYKGICFTKNTSNVFNQYDFKSYNVKIIQRRKELKQE